MTLTVKTPERHEDLEDYVDTFEEDQELYADFLELDTTGYEGDDALLLTRWQQLWALQEHYTDFRDFYHDVSVDLLGFVPTDMQFDIADYCQTSPQYSMIQAQRGEAKTTITGAYAVWCLIHNPQTIILIVSAGGDMSQEVASWIIQIINGMDVLECLRPDKNHPTTRTSLEKYDVHHDLKGPNKSPSISCVGITSNMQGKRAHLLIADDVESGKNSATQTMREQLLLKTRDFISINRYGKIMYLGTPQTVDSIYKKLPGRGYEVRIWTGRFPTEEEEKNYGNNLAPFITSRMIKDPECRIGGGVTGDRGKPTDPGMGSEALLTATELDQGPAYFNLQFMLDTALSDQGRYPLKIKDAMFMALDSEEAPGKVIWGPRPDLRIPQVQGCDLNLEMYMPANVHKETFAYERRLLAIDPAGEGGKNNDETGYSVIFMCNGYYFCMANGGIQNATSEEGKDFWTVLMQRWGIKEVIVERNFGGGMFKNYIEGVITSAEIRASVEEVWSSGQKELRIIDSIDPILGNHRLVFNIDIPMQDMLTVQQYSVDKRNVYRLLWQLEKLSRDRGSLIHEDRLEALAIGLRHLKQGILIDHDKKVKAVESDRMLAMMRNPRGITTRNPGMYQSPPGLNNLSAMQRFNRR